ncbi:polymer-forming cytoskeletal protein [Dehalobacterium formicoaceticum]|uniref:polymer-forming cytoskeletal protein n=1 Tax=Dehalobacterium formicoaceticum TaxID=51515 RepID=UPI0031F6AFF1
MIKLKKTLGCFLLITAMLLVFSCAALGDQYEDWFAPDSALSGDNVVVSAEKNVKGPGFYSGSTVHLQGNIDGTTFAAGQSVIVDGIINGDLIVAGQYVHINGKVTGNIYAAAQNLEIKGAVTGDVFGVGQMATVTSDALLSRDVFLAGETVTFSGAAGRQLFVGVNRMILQGTVGDNANIAAENISIQDSAVIKGNLNYNSANEALISSQAQITGERNWHKSSPGQAKDEKRPMMPWQGALMNMLWSIASALLLWFVIKIWRPEAWAKTTRTITQQPLKTIGVGALVLILTPIVAILLMVTMIGIPLGIILGLIYSVSLYLAKIVVAIFIGAWVANKFSWPEKHKGVWLALLGLVIYSVASIIPWVGFPVILITLLTGLGAIALSFGRPKKQEETPVVPE